MARWGIIGPGRIANPVCEDLQRHVPGAQVVAVASRSLERAQDFAQRHGIPRAHGSYAAILDDADVDVLYVATPHPQHRAIALAAIAAGKPVLVEKAFTATLEGAQEVVEAARAAGVLVMEAMKTPFYPAVQAMLAEQIGPIGSVESTFGFPAGQDPTSRLRSLELGGGPLLDIGIYGVSFAEIFLGMPQALHVVGSRMETGVDLEATLLLDHGDGRASTTTASFARRLPNTARVLGTDGWLEVSDPFHQPDGYTVHRGDEVTRHDIPPVGHGFTHELVEMEECLRDGRTESSVVSLDRTLGIQRVLNQACEALGVWHVDDPTPVT